MDFSSSSSNSQFRTSSAFAGANSAGPSSPSDLPIRDTAPRFSASANSGYGGIEVSSVGEEARTLEKVEEGVDRPAEEEREHMFDKVVTPSDVGKLNRLVIPKQHAEKHFPLDSSSSEKGLLLDFEDRDGKSWRFRYSYWNSSQSYVMTKGWSRFVKEKKLDAGDVVSFQRGRSRLYIDWRRRPGAPHPPPYHHQFSFNPFLLNQPPLAFHRQSPVDRIQLPTRVVTRPNIHQSGLISYTGLGSAANSSGYNEVLNSPNYASFCNGLQGSVSRIGPPHQIQSPAEFPIPSNQTPSGPSGASVAPMVLESFPAGTGKRLRLFGVNMNCTVDPDPDSEALDPAEEADGSLQLRLNSSSATTTPTSSSIEPATDSVDKGKSSVTFDFDF